MEMNEYSLNERENRLKFTNSRSAPFSSIFGPVGCKPEHADYQGLTKIPVKHSNTPVAKQVKS